MVTPAVDVLCILELDWGMQMLKIIQSAITIIAEKFSLKQIKIALIII